ncbi:8504_t:CDS:2, partial [Gigaspora margarita]
WIVTKVILDHDHPMVELNKVATFLQYRVMNLNQKNLIRRLHNNNAPTHVITTAANEVIDSGIICTKDVVNKCARIRYALNEGYNNDLAQKLLKLFEEPAKCVARCSEVLIVDATYKTNIYKFPLVKDETEAPYTWFLQTLCTEIYNTYSCLPDVFISDRDQALRNASSKHILEQNLKANCHKLFKTDDDYEVFKKEVMNLRFITVEEQISQSLSAVKKAVEKAHTPEKVESYIQTLMKDSTMWISAYTK